MEFDQEAIERLSQAARVEVQDYYARRFLAECEPRQPERRRSMRLKFRKRDWPHTWNVNDPERYYRRTGGAIRGW